MSDRWDTKRINEKAVLLRYIDGDDGVEFDQWELMGEHVEPHDIAFATAGYLNSVEDKSAKWDAIATCTHDNAIKREGEVQRWCGDCGAIYVDDYAGGEWLLPGART